MVEEVMLAFNLVFEFEVFLAVILGVLGGILIGVLPGLTATMAVAILVPVTFGMSPIAAIGMLVGVYKSGIHGGSVSAILIHTPGTPAAAATALDGYELAKQGKSLKALDMDLYASVFASTISALALIFIALPLSRLTQMLGSPEYFAILVFSLTIIGGVSGRSITKGVISGTIGLLLSSVGMDPMYGSPRFLFGMHELSGGFSFIPLLIGMYALSEIFIQSEQGRKELRKRPEVIVDLKDAFRKGENRDGLLEGLINFSKYIRTTVYSTFYGIGIGVLPGIGPAIASFLAYSESRRRSQKPEEYGKGSIEGLIAAEAGNNGVTGATMVPLLTLGIPGDTTMAVLLGALMVHGLTPGPLLFEENAPEVYAIFATLIIACVALLFIGYLAIPFFSRVVTVPKAFLFPIIIVMCIVGSYAVNNRIFEILVLFGGGLLGYVFRKYGFPLAPVNIAFLLGPMVEMNMRQSLVISGGDPLIFLVRPVSATFLALTLVSIYFIAKRVRLEKLKPDKT